MVCGLVKADSVSDHLFATACHINWNGLILSFYFYPVNVLHYSNCCFYTVCYTAAFVDYSFVDLRLSDFIVEAFDR